MARLRAWQQRVPWLEGLIVVGTLLVANRFTWLCVFEIHRPVYWCEYGSFADELVIYVVLLVAVLALLRRSPLRRAWEAAWRRTPLVIAFVAWCIASIAWSVSPVHTMYRSVLALVATVVASYLGIRYRSSGWIRILTGFAAATVILSFALVWLHPQAAIMSTSSLVGAWRGVFAQRNLTGAILAYGASVLALAAVLEKRARLRLVLWSLVAASIVFVYFTGSATGMIVLVILGACLASLLAWIHFRPRLRRIHYAAAALFLLAAVWLASTHITELLQLLGKSSTLTGRVPLWTFVISEAERRPWLGYGLWTAWRFGLFRNLAAREARWPTPIGDSHNGFLDVLLYLGGIGLALFLAVAAQTGWRALMRLRETGSPRAIWPVLTVAYILISNLTISFVLNRESFHWVLLVVAMFAVSAEEHNAARPASATDRSPPVKRKETRVDQLGRRNSTVKNS
jgi:exopolysaccharide production protein ExoQ